MFCARSMKHGTADLIRNPPRIAKIQRQMLYHHAVKQNASQARFNCIPSSAHGVEHARPRAGGTARENTRPAHRRIIASHRIDHTHAANKLMHSQLLCAAKHHIARELRTRRTPRRQVSRQPSAPHRHAWQKPPTPCIKPGRPSTCPLRLAIQEFRHPAPDQHTVQKHIALMRPRTHRPLPTAARSRPGPPEGSHATRGRCAISPLPPQPAPVAACSLCASSPSNGRAPSPLRKVPGPHPAERRSNRQKTATHSAN